MFLDFVAIQGLILPGFQQHVLTERVNMQQKIDEKSIRMLKYKRMPRKTHLEQNLIFIFIFEKGA